MEHIELLYKPKGNATTYEEFKRPSGYTGRIIHMHDAHEICLIASRSECVLYSGGNRWTIPGPAIILHRAGSYHELISISENGAPYDGRVIYFRSDGLPADFFPGELLEQDCLVIPLADAEDVLPYFRLVQNEQNARRQLALLMLLNRMAEQAKERSGVIRGDAQDSYIFDVIKTISDHLADSLTVHTLATRFHVSESKLKQDFTATTGMTMKRFTTQLRLRQAKSMLQNTDLEVGDIAYRCGFSGESHFIDVFHKHLGTTPGKFRKGETHHV